MLTTAPIYPPVWTTVPQIFDDTAHSKILNRETIGADAVLRSFDRVDRSGVESIADDKFGRTLSMYNIDGIHSGQYSPRDTLIQGSQNSMLAMYSGTGRLFNINI